MPIDLPLDNTTLADKLDAMEVLWTNISREPADLPSPEWHKDILEKNRQLFSARCLIEDETIDVYAVLDCRSDPERIVNRLGSSKTER